MKSLLPPLTNSLLTFFLPQRSDPALAAAALPPSSLFERDPESGPDQFDVRKKPAKVETHFTEDLEEKMEEERRWKEDSLRKLANIQIKKVDQTRRKECLREKGKGSRNSEDNFNVVEVLVSRDGYNLID